ncbi:hypothetical protein HY629_00335 [Candidatus Uhrbacteria bacterium]|nr:hypothetical protein [Candidatus Uhrbacteria bacterium]
MPELRDHPAPPSDTQPSSPEALLGVHRNALTPEVRQYADNLRDQVRKIWKDHGVQNIDEFEVAARTKKISRAEVKDVQGLMEKLAAVVASGELPPEEMQKNKERELLRAEGRRQARTLWAKGWGDAIRVPVAGFANKTLPRYNTFEEYVQSIPEPPPQPEQWKGRFDRLVLVDERISVLEACEELGLAFAGAQRRFKTVSAAKPESGVRWMWCNDGKENQSRTPMQLRLSCPKDQTYLTVFEGIALYAQDPTLITDVYAINLVGSNEWDYPTGILRIALSKREKKNPMLLQVTDGLFSPEPSVGAPSRGVSADISSVL